MANGYTPTVQGSGGYTQKMLDRLALKEQANDNWLPNMGGTTSPAPVTTSTSGVSSAYPTNQGPTKTNTYGGPDFLNIKPVVIPTGTSGTGVSGTGTSGDVVTTPTNIGTNVNNGSFNSLFPDNTDANNANANFVNNLTNDANYNGTVESEYEIQKKANQARIDASNQYYNDLKNRQAIVNEGNSGGTRAFLAGAGMIGGSRGQAIASTQTGANQSALDAIDNARANAENEILSNAKESAQAQYDAKIKAKQAGASSLLEYYNVTLPGMKKTAAKKAALVLLNNNFDPNTLSDSQIASTGVSKADLINEYNDLKARKASGEAEAKATADKNALENTKTQAEIDKLNREASKNYEVGGVIYGPDGQKIGEKVGNNYEAGGRVYEAGTNKYIGDARSVANTGGGSSSTGVGSGPIVTTTLANGKSVTMVQGAANALNNVISSNPGIQIDYGNVYRTPERQLELYGQGRTAEQLAQQGIDGKYAQPGKPVVTWTPNQSKHMSGNAIDVVLPSGQDKVGYYKGIDAQMNAAGFYRPNENISMGDYGH